MLLSDFWTIIDLTAQNAAQFFTLTNSAIIIEDPVPVSLFGLAFGFVVLEFILYQINRLRPGSSSDFESMSTGASARNSPPPLDNRFLKDYVKRRRGG